MKTKTAFLNIFFLSVGIITFLPNSVWAAVNGPCVNCHIMHNSQGGQTIEGGEDGPYRHLTKGDCIGCHTGDNSGGSSSNGDIPYVMGLSQPTYPTLTTDGNTLAGGNFWWVAYGDDNKGHNVLGLSDVDLNHSEAPGGTTSCANSCHLTLAEKQESILTDLGSGCEGCHLAVAHHAPDHPINYSNVVSEDEGWFRYCSGHRCGSGHGVEGIEDDDWEYNPTSTDHNEYLGFVGDHTKPGNFKILGNTMTAYCCGCHKNFHIQQDDGGAWIRHPSDAALPETYAYTVYEPLAPVARPDLDEYSGPSATVTPGTDLVMCLSCHRAHGSPYASMLRWSGSEEDDGCKICHTTND
ncbi:MAG: hypothetical protein J7K15_13590 [Deltaproteobacteria bacterium]|nr:hypothetical protein [Deltaproteobacteria bacterium]